jgi:hypothetical protein
VPRASLGGTRRPSRGILRWDSRLPPALLEALARVRGEAGSAAGYLVRHGLPRPAVDTLRRALVVA